MNDTPSEITRLVTIGNERVVLFSQRDGLFGDRVELLGAVIREDGETAYLRARSKDFTEWLARIYWTVHRCAVKPLSVARALPIILGRGPNRGFDPHGPDAAVLDALKRRSSVGGENADAASETVKVEDAVLSRADRQFITAWRSAFGERQVRAHQLEELARPVRALTVSRDKNDHVSLRSLGKYLRRLLRARIPSCPIRFRHCRGGVCYWLAD